MKKYFDIQPTTRDEQIEALKAKLRLKFDTLPFSPEPFSGAVNDYEHQKEIYVSNRLARFINTDDNSLYGFKVKCTASFLA